jgi:lauroyl/myristoyl acyltransferase
VTTHTVDRRVSANVAELLRILGMLGVLTPAAYLLPRAIALWLADCISLLLMLLRAPGIDTYFEMRTAYGTRRLASLKLAQQRLARPLRDFVIQRRILYRREKPLHWKILEKNADEVADLRESGQSYIVATAHFQREAFLATACPTVVHGRLVQVGVPAPRGLESVRKVKLRIRKEPLAKVLYDMRIRVQYGTMLQALASSWDRQIEFAYVGPDRFAAGLLYTRLRERGNVVNIHVDGAWPRPGTGAYSRPFAGLKRRSFSTGVAQLARLAQCPIVSCVYWLDRDGTIILEWGSPIRRVDNEIDVMDRLIDVMEIAVGERPTQYMLAIGRERCWNSSAKRWEDRAV